MYERNAIVLERYFEKLFGYNEKNNLKNNYDNYIELINKIEKYQEATSEEDQIILEYDRIVNKIKDIQKNQEMLNKKNAKLQESRKDLFESLDESVDTLNDRLERLEEETQKNNEEMKTNGENFIEELNEFNEKSDKRNESSRNRRIIENSYQKQLKETITNMNGINTQKVNDIKTFFKSENNIQEEIQQKIIKNGSREKIPFDLNVIERAIDLESDIEEKMAEILCMVYDRTHRLLVEIKNDTIKLKKHKKLIRDSESKMSFLNAMKEYLTAFLDNERLNIVGGEKEHKKLMDEACDNMEQDLDQIKNLYNLLNKEMTGRATKKMYKDLYNLDYLYDLEEQEKEFESNISRLNVIGTVIYPDYWRIEGMQKIYMSFKNSVQNIYGRDLSEFEPITSMNNDLDIEESKDNILNSIDDDYDDEYDDYDDDTVDIKEIQNLESEDEEEQFEEKDKEIDEILGFYNFDDDLTDKKSDEDEEDANEKDDNEDDDEDDEIDEYEESNVEDKKYDFDYDEYEEDNIEDKKDDFDDDEDEEMMDEENEDKDEDYSFDEDDDEEDEGYDDIDFDVDDEDEDFEDDEEESYKNK